MITMHEVMTTLQPATMRARARTGDQSIGTSAGKGKIRVESVTFEGRKAIVKPLSDWLTCAEAVAFLDAM